MKGLIGIAAVLALTACGGGSDTQPAQLVVETEGRWFNGELVLADDAGNGLTMSGPGDYDVDILDTGTLRVEQNPPGLICGIGNTNGQPTVTCVAVFDHRSQCNTGTDSDKDGVTDCQEMLDDDTDPWDQFDHKGIKPGLTVYHFGEWQGSSLLIKDGLGRELAISQKGHHQLGDLDLNSLYVKANPRNAFCELKAVDDFVAVNCHDTTLSADACVFSTDSDGDGISDCQEKFEDGTDPWDSLDHSGNLPELTVHQVGEWEEGSLVIRDGFGGHLTINQGGHYQLGELDRSSLYVKTNPRQTFCELRAEDSRILVSCHDKTIAAEACVFSTDSDGDGVTDCTEYFSDGTDAWDAEDHSDVQSFLTILQQGTWGHGSLSLQDALGETRHYNQDGIYPLRGIDLETAEIVAAPYGLFCTLTTAPRELTVHCGDTIVGECSHQVDSDADGLSDCDEFEKGTNPWLADTDGDGKNDLIEVNLYSQSSGIRNNPLIANTPELGVQIVTKPKATIHYSQGQSVSTGESTSQETAFSASQTRTTGSERSIEYANSETLAHAHSIDVGLSFKASIIPSTEVTISNSFSRELNHTTTEGAAFSYSAAQSTENSASYQQAVDRSQQSNVDMTSAELQVGLRLKNLSFTDYSVADLVLSAYWIDPANPHRLETIGNLTFDNAADKGITMIGNSTSELLIFSITDLPLDKALRIMRRSEQIMVRPASYALRVADGSNALLGDEDVAERTARVEMDFGAGGFGTINKRVAVNRGVTDFTSAYDILHQVFGMPFEQGRRSWANSNGLNAPTVESAHGLVALNGLDMNSDLGSYWQVSHERLTGNGYGQREVINYNLLESGYDLRDIEVHTGDVLVFSYVTDTDRDGLTNQVEANIGTSSTDIDSDGDGISDGLEVTGWYYSTEPDGHCYGKAEVPDYRIFSDPLLADSDDDGINDGDEVLDCTAPSFKTNVDVSASADYLSEGDTLMLQADSTQFPPSASYTWQLIEGPRNSGGGFDQVVEVATGARVQFAVNGVGKQRWQLSVVSDGEERLAEVEVLVVKDIAKAVFVDTAADPGVKTGSYEAPYPSLAEALVGASGPNARTDIYMVGSQQHDHRGATIDLSEAVSFYGGFDQDWYYTGGKTELQLHSPGLRYADVDPYATITVKGMKLTQVDADQAVALQVDGAGAGQLNIVDSDISAGNATGQAKLSAGVDKRQGLSSYGLHLLAPVKVAITNSRIVAGSGATGLDGQAGQHGMDLGGYLAGFTKNKGRGVCNNPVHPDGWRHAPDDIRHTDKIWWGCGPDAVWDWGKSARPANGGASGESARASNDIFSHYYVPASGEDGGLGEPGSGGSAAWDSGPSFGGVGGGGGQGGTGGSGGGGSFAIWANNQQAGGSVVIDIRSGSRIVAGGGGDGGAGKIGGKGGKAADGWDGGGKGAKGGHGGHGGGGVGGTVAAIALSGSASVSVHDALIETSAPGKGGFHAVPLVTGGDRGNAFSYYYIDAGNGYNRVSESSSVRHNINGEPSKKENVQ
ncbi:hypothetical protein [Marinobacter xestospongiae]|uniref:hypothetical protein n=1 Tax=Marinobacter xestospongiae TaxID=994319 RepID=UPI00249F5332|nr:hypothetical protein [Marinobacter xestospongiae]